MNLFNYYLLEIIKKVLNSPDFKKINKKSLSNVIVESPPEKYNFDLSTNIALILSKIIKTNTRDIAVKIKLILINKINDFAEIEIAGPGFLNIRLSKTAWIKNINISLKEKKNFGANKNKKKYNIEFVSANPTGPLHVGHCRGAVFGDVISNLLSFNGNNVT